MPTTEMTEKEVGELKAKGTAIEARAAEIVINSNEDYEYAGQVKIEIKAERDRIMDKPLGAQADANRVKRFLDDVVRMVRAPFDRAEETVDVKMTGWRRKIEEKRQEEQRKADAKAREEAQKKRDAEIEAAKKLGDKEGAKNLKQAPVTYTPPPPKTVAPPKIKGVTIRRVWDYQVTDENKIPRKYFVLDHSAIGKVVRALGANAGIPGITPFEKEVQ